ncbi:uncharacterized protein LOC134291980 [Aedes albopictus]|uniref:Uncharacterized protein n=1 Tax=Aedes albopictus TaxID=7160 RepID=A0ABM1Z5V3_AEDAL
MDSGDTSSIRKKSIKERLRLLEQQHLIRITQLEEEGRRSRQAYERSVERIEQATAKAITKIKLHCKAKRDARARTSERENVGETLPVVHSSFSDGTLVESICSPPVQCDGIASAPHRPSIQIVRPNALRHFIPGTENDEEDLHTTFSPELAGGIDAIENFRSKEGSSMQTVLHSTVGVKSCFHSTVHLETLSKSNSSRSMGQPEIVNITTTIVDQSLNAEKAYSVTKPITVTQIKIETNCDYPEQELSHHSSLLEYIASRSRMCKGEPIRKIVVVALFTCDSSRSNVVEMDSLMVSKYSSIPTETVGRVFVAEKMDFDGRCDPLRKIDSIGFDPGGLKNGAQVKLVLVKRPICVNYLVNNSVHEYSHSERLSWDAARRLESPMCRLSIATES